MSPDVFNETLVALCERIPFRPITVILNSGDRVQIDHPRALALRGGFAMFAGPGSKPYFFESDAVSQIIGDMIEEENSTS